MKKKDRGQEYIDAFPKLKKWVKECVCCHRKGYDPNIPEEIHEGSYESYFVKKYYNPLSINEDGLCEICENILKQSKK